MKPFFLLPLFLLKFLLSGAQIDLAKQIRGIAHDSANGFNSFKGLFQKMQLQDSVFYSITTIEGTSKNSVINTREMDLYLSVVIDSVKKKEGERIADKWREKLIALLDGDFQEEKIKTVSYNPAIYGWKYMKGHLLIDITLYPVAPESSLCRVSLGLTYFHGTE